MDAAAQRCRCNGGIGFLETEDNEFRSVLLSTRIHHESRACITSGGRPLSLEVQGQSPAQNGTNILSRLGPVHLSIRGIDWTTVHLQSTIRVGQLKDVRLL